MGFQTGGPTDRHDKCIGRFFSNSANVLKRAQNSRASATSYDDDDDDNNNNTNTNATDNNINTYNTPGMPQQAR